MSGRKSGATKRREELRLQHWPGEDELWTGEDEKGWFRAPRTLPLILALLATREISENKDPCKVYLELLSRHIDGGVVEMEHEADHAFASGYEGQRAVRTWQERMHLLDDLGFIRTVPIGNQQYKLVALVHPTVAIQQLYDKGKIKAHWWNAYCERKAQTREATFEQRKSAKT